MKPGDRRQRWQQTCTAEGLIMLFIGGAFICNGGWGASICGAICILGSAVSFLDAGRGWKMKDTRPPWADKHDEINRRGEERLKRYLKESTDD